MLGIRFFLNDYFSFVITAIHNLIVNFVVSSYFTRSRERITRAPAEHEH